MTRKSFLHRAAIATFTAVGAARTGFAADAASPGSDSGAAAPRETGDAAAIRAVLSSYNTALNASSTDAVMRLYAPDGVFMPCYSASSVGATAIRKAYEDVFKAITLDVKFDIVELVLMSPEWAFARTNSAGTQTDHATGRRTSEGNQELFIFHNSAGEGWRISRYCFSPTNPPGNS